MRRRGDVIPQVAAMTDAEARPPVKGQEQSVAVPANYDWTKQNGPEGSAAALKQSAGEGKSAGEKSAAKIAPTEGPASMPALVAAGDSLTITMGKEVYYPGGSQKFNGFEVGPMSITVTIRAGESAAQAWVRGRSVLEHLFEAELDLRISEFVEHLDIARKTVRGE